MREGGEVYTTGHRAITLRTFLRNIRSWTIHKATFIHSYSTLTPINILLE